MKKKKINKEISCPHIKGKESVYIYEVGKLSFLFCQECHNSLFNKMKEQKALEDSLDNKSFWERKCDELGVKVLKIKKRSWIDRFFSLGIDNYRITFSYKGLVISINGWAGPNHDKDWLFWDIWRFIKDEKDELNFNKFLEDYK